MMRLTDRPLDPLTEIDIICSIFNQELIIERILAGIFANTITPFNLILVFDGCTDQSEHLALEYIKVHKPLLMRSLIIRTASNVYETRANNIGLRLAKNLYAITLQDDMAIREQGWEIRLTYPLRAFNEVFAVTGRAALDILKDDGHDGLRYFNRAAREFFSLPRNVFSVRDIINRGPIAFRMRDLEKLHLFNEEYAPGGLDDADLCLRAWEQEKLVCGAFWINYLSKPNWSKTKSTDSSMNIGASQLKNAKKIQQRHAEYISKPTKHSLDKKIQTQSIDYPPLFSRTKLAWQLRALSITYLISRVLFHLQRFFLRIQTRSRAIFK